jgi:hypothetical protein
LPHGIEVIGEYPLRGLNRYVRVRIRPHRFFPEAKRIAGGCCVRRSRVVMASKLGRALLVTENVHHRDEDRTNDSPDNLQLIGTAEHNRHHKTGSKHSEKSKRRISAGLRLAISEGRRLPPRHPDWTGKKHTLAARRKISESRKMGIANGSIRKPLPPSPLGRKMPDSVKEKIRASKLRYWSIKKGIAQ